MVKQRLVGATASAATLIVASSLLIPVPSFAADREAISAVPAVVIASADRGSTPTRSNDGRQLVEALAFGSGPQVSEISSIPGFAKQIETAKANQSRAQAIVIWQILDQVAVANPDLYASVATDLRSGDPFAVKQSFVSISDAVRQAITDLANESQMKGTLQSVGAPRSPVVVLAVVFHVAAAVTGVAVAAVEAAVVAGAVLWTVNLAWGRSDDAVVSDRLVADLTVALD